MRVLSAVGRGCWVEIVRVGEEREALMVCLERDLTEAEEDVSVLFLCEVGGQGEGRCHILNVHFVAPVRESLSAAAC